MNLNAKQIMLIIGAILSVLVVSTAQLAEIFGSGIAKSIVSVAGLFNATLNAVLVAITGQGATFNEVRQMEGVENIFVNADANKTLASIAVDPAVNNVGPAPHARPALEATARGE